MAEICRRGFRYDNTIYNGYIPAYHLTMSRLFSKWDGEE